MDGTFPTAKKGGVIMTKESGGFDQIDQWKSLMFAGENLPFHQEFFV